MLRTDPTKYVKQTMPVGSPSAILRPCPDPGAVVGPDPRLWMSDKSIGRSGTDGNPALRGDLTRLRAALPLAGRPHHRGLAHRRRALARPAALRPLHPRPLRARRPRTRARAAPRRPPPRLGDLPRPRLGAPGPGVRSPPRLARPRRQLVLRGRLPARPRP